MGIHSVGTSDAALVRRVHAGDTGAYADLVARYRDRLGRYALHMLGNREDAEEVRSEEHTSELQSQFHLVCRLLLEKKKTVSSDKSAPLDYAARPSPRTRSGRSPLL